jgi:prophage maintenance system killer protein
MKNQIEIYKSMDGQTEVEVRFEEETVWLNQYQLAELFNTDRTSILKHLKNIYQTQELDEKATCAKIAQVRQEGQRKVTRQIFHYNLDAIISVGYRANSKRGTQFRQWATKRLKDYLVQGYAINEKRLEQKKQEVRHLKDGIRILSRAIEDKAADTDFEWLNLYAAGLRLLDDYDHETLDSKGATVAPVDYPSYEDYISMVKQMRADFDSTIFGHERGHGFKSAVEQIKQSFSGKELYPTFEEKAATLLYLIVKNHAFVDGKKRIAAACFLLFLQANDRMGTGETLAISNEALASLTLFVAVSRPAEMETVKQLIISILNRNKV